MRAVRELGQQRVTNRARMALAAADRAERRMQAARDEGDRARADLTAIWLETCARFGREVPRDALVLDVLDSVVVEAGDCWRWLGPTNNKSLPCFRSPVDSSAGRGERSVVRFLAVAFGVIASDDWGVLYPTGGRTWDVNPFNRTLRRSSAPIGNPARYAFSAEEPA